MRKKVVYTDHLKFRLNQRNIPYDLPKIILQNAKEYYFDTKTNYYIALAEVNYKEKTKEFIVVFEIHDSSY